MLKTLLILLLSAALLLAASEIKDLQYYQWASEHRIPECPEDAVLVGQGQFDNGTWYYYKCGPAVDDYPPPTHP